MNYRHAYHAGNFADVMKHSLLLSLLATLERKEGGFAVLDTHAGCGMYDLSGEEAEKTREWRDGIEHVLNSDAEALAPYLAAIRRLGAPGRYPGSPALIANALRPQDRLMACELHPDDVRPLRRLFRCNEQVAVHHRDGYEAIRALLPPKPQKRGLVLIDAPFEQTDEFSHLASAIIETRERFPTGIIAAWYPIKHRAPVRAFFDTLRDRGQRALLACELNLRPPLDPSRLNGSGLLIVRPPYRFDEEATSILKALAPLLAPESGETSVEWIAEE